MQILRVRIIPETWIIAPYATSEQLKRYAEKGWITKEEAEHLDRAFPRNSEGKPIIFKSWLLSPMKKAADRLKIPRKQIQFDIVDEDGMPLNYIVIPGKPLRYVRAILASKPSAENFEYIDGTYTLEFLAVPVDPKAFAQALAVAGKIGLLARTKYGYGKFRVEIGVKAK